MTNHHSTYAMTALERQTTLADDRRVAVVRRHDGEITETHRWDDYIEVCGLTGRRRDIIQAALLRSGIHQLGQYLDLILHDLPVSPTQTLRILHPAPRGPEDISLAALRGLWVNTDDFDAFRQALVRRGVGWMPRARKAPDLVPALLLGVGDEALVEVGDYVASAPNPWDHKAVTGATPVQVLTRDRSRRLHRGTLAEVLVAFPGVPFAGLLAALETGTFCEVTLEGEGFLIERAYAGPPNPMEVDQTVVRMSDHHGGVEEWRGPLGEFFEANDDPANLGVAEIEACRAAIFEGRPWWCGGGAAPLCRIEPAETPDTSGAVQALVAAARQAVETIEGLSDGEEGAGPEEGVLALLRGAMGPWG